MKFWLSGEVQADASDGYMEAMKDVEAALNTGMGDLEIPQLKSWDFIAIIRQLDSPTYNELKRYHSRDASLEFRLKIDHGEFVRADPLGARRLLMESLLRSVEEARTVVPAGMDLMRIGLEMLAVAKANAWLRQN